ncbi:MAG: D-amino acid aminotransferase [Firmicutes bacterium]|nr:D-amino acid aminotransferase [Alicyclobacillaceae bacterium]MCL6496479.1 D-amino acid aminotransferase [Bacillota bacterium]
MRVYLNGEFVDISQARIPIDDRGFLFGDAVYEVIHLYGDLLFAWDLHIERLRFGLQALEFPPVDLDALRQAADELKRDRNFEEGSLYIQISRGVHPRSHLFPPEGTAPTVVMWIRPVEPVSRELLAEGVRVITVPDDRWAKVWIKTVGLLPNVLAKQKAHRQGAYEAIFVRDGVVTEASSANVFIVRGGVLRTAPETNYILPGITREVTLRLARALNLPMELRPFTPDEMYTAEEAFLTGTNIGILPVTTVDGRYLGKPGPVTRRLLEAFWAETKVSSRLG